MKNPVAEMLLSLVVGGVLTATSYAIGFAAGWIDAVSAVEAVGVMLNYSCVWLTARQNLWAWPIGIAAVIALGVLFWQATLLASFTLYIGYFLPIQFVGWYVWAKGRDQFEYPVTHLTSSQWGYTLMGIPVAALAVWSINSYFGGITPFFDGLILVLSIIAQYLLNYKKIESWYGWFAVNVTSIYVYASAGLFVLAVQYVMFLGNAIYGYYKWRTSPEYMMATTLAEILQQEITNEINAPYIRSIRNV